MLEQKISPNAYVTILHFHIFRDLTMNVRMSQYYISTFLVHAPTATEIIIMTKILKYNF
jgi:hypothetical protein